MLLGGLAGATAAPPPGDGGAAYRKHCVACHALEPGINTPAGPSLHRVVGRRIASEAEFNYSPALRSLAARERRWSAELLERFLADPDVLAPGTEMGFAGLRDDGERQALIAWLERRARPARRRR